jgi:hypothetical protein
MPKARRMLRYKHLPGNAKIARNQTKPLRGFPLRSNQIRPFQCAVLAPSPNWLDHLSCCQDDLCNLDQLAISFTSQLLHLPKGLLLV